MTDTLIPTIIFILISLACVWVVLVRMIIKNIDDRQKTENNFKEMKRLVEEMYQEIGEKPPKL